MSSTVSCGCCLGVSTGTVEWKVQELGQVIQARDLENGMEECLDFQGHENPVRIYVSEDAHLLNCPPPHHSIPPVDRDADCSLFGVLEEAADAGTLSAADDPTKDISLSLTHYSFPDIQSSPRTTPGQCTCPSASNDWTRTSSSSSSSTSTPTTQPPPVDHTHEEEDDDDTKTTIPFRFVDLTGLQQRRHDATESDDLLRLDRPARVFHFLRSVLSTQESPTSNALHRSSPWLNQRTNATTTKDDHLALVAVLVLGGSPSSELESSPSLEEQELAQLLKFRTGDAAPSYYLYSASHVKDVLTLKSTLLSTVLANDGTVTPGMLLVYRPIPKRIHLMRQYPFGRSNSVDHGPDEAASPTPNHSADGHEALMDGCLWEEYPVLEEGQEEGEGAFADEPEMAVRMVAPPYLDPFVEFPSFNKFVSPEHLAILQEEVKRIPQWTAWPETQHYSSSKDGESASWTVFPLCHTFPANDASQFKWISKTSSLVPGTTELLKECFMTGDGNENGMLLRTALFSRLDPETTLGTHTGWADLSNHVVRIHIPLVGPADASLCGAWVDGCVESHNRPVCFDDSKVHRAFNYAQDEERIVLIVDLIRPSNIPTGTATGGHTEELDAFIQSVS